MNNTTRPAGAIAVKLDPEILLTAGREAFAAQYPEDDATHLSNGPLPQMLLTVDRGTGAVVNREGVGAIADETDHIEVYFDYAGIWTPVSLALDKVGDAATEERIDLAEGIRSFGSRLDVNHLRWFNRYDADNSAQ